MCGREVKPEAIDEETMPNYLKPEKEEKVKALLRTHSVREIVKKTGVAKGTIARIRNENLTEEEKAELKNRALIKSRGKRELGKMKPKPIKNMPIKAIQTELVEVPKYKVFEIPENLTFVDITGRYVEYLNKRHDEIMTEIKRLVKEFWQIATHLSTLDEFLVADQNDKNLSEDNAYRQYIQMESDSLDVPEPQKMTEKIA
jgi:hypothetical protein